MLAVLSVVYQTSTMLYRSDNLHCMLLVTAS